jgi:hypothetical protein
MLPATRAVATLAARRQPSLSVAARPLPGPVVSAAAMGRLALRVGSIAIRRRQWSTVTQCKWFRNRLNRFAGQLGGASAWLAPPAHTQRPAPYLRLEAYYFISYPTVVLLEAAACRQACPARNLHADTAASKLYAESPRRPLRHSTAETLT